VSENIDLVRNWAVIGRPSERGVQRVHRTRARRQIMLHISSNASHSLYDVIMQQSTKSNINTLSRSRTFYLENTFFVQGAPADFSYPQEKFMSEALVIGELMTLRVAIISSL